MQILGIDIGGTGIKGAPVDTETGMLLASRHRIPTPEQAKPKPVARVVGELAAHFGWQGPVGCGFPAVVRQGVVYTAANIHKSWIGTNVEALFTESAKCPTHVLNDADAAGLAEMAFGAGKDQKGLVLMVTIGTGLGTVLFTDGHLVPNLELGHIEIKGEDAEVRATDAARKRDKLSWKQWAKRFDLYLTTLEKLLWPDMIILGGGVIKKYEEFSPYLTVKAKVVPAQFLNDAGIVGAALSARQ
jgi:polyphosphate glucokinase